MDIASLGAATPSATAADKSAVGLADTFDTFLTLLTTQLKFQDPLKPMDSTEFTNQLVQFSQVEQSISTNKHLEQLLGLQNQNQSVAALGYIGKSVEAEGSQIALVDGEAQFTYTLPANAASANILILDGAGRLVRSIPANIAAGKHGYTWDGEASDGSTMPDGAYTVAVSAQDANNDVIKATTALVGTVTGTETGENGTLLAVGPVKVEMAKVRSVTAPGGS